MQNKFQYISSVAVHFFIFLLLHPLNDTGWLNFLFCFYHLWSKQSSWGCIHHFYCHLCLKGKGQHCPYRTYVFKDSFILIILLHVKQTHSFFCSSMVLWHFLCHWCLFVVVFVIIIVFDWRSGGWMLVLFGFTTSWCCHRQNNKIDKNSFFP